MTANFIANPLVIQLYGLTLGRTFEQEFSIISLENILFDLFSYLLFVHEQIVQANAQNSRPHTLRWYREQVLRFLDGLPLVWKDDQFKYDLTNVIDVDQRKVIDRCAVLESNNGELVIKIATDNNGSIEQVTTPQLIRFKAYMNQIKDAGNRIRIINQPGDQLKVIVTIYVDPLVIDLQTGKQLNALSNVFPVKDAIKLYLENLEFNGAFVRTFFQDALQRAVGVRVPIINNLKSQYAGFPFQTFAESKIPESGYFKINDADLTINYLADVGTY